MTKEQTQASWSRTHYTTKVTMPGGRSKQFDMTKWYTSVDFNKLDGVELDGLEYSVKQKLSDSLTQLGKGATVQDKFDRMDTVWNMLCNDRAFKAPSKIGGKQISDAEYQKQADTVIADAQESGDFSEVAERLKIIARLRIPVTK